MAPREDLPVVVLDLTNFSIQCWWRAANNCASGARKTMS